MNLEEAMYEQRAYLTKLNVDIPYKVREAMKWGNEAMKRVQLYRKGLFIGLGDKMPGETTD